MGEWENGTRTYLEKSHCDTHRDTRASLTPLVTRDRPGVPLQLLQHARQAVLALADGEEEPRRSKRARESSVRGRSSRPSTRSRRGGETKHLVDRLGCVLLRATEDE
jgi:hypothetical protein